MSCHMRQGAAGDRREGASARTRPRETERGGGEGEVGAEEEWMVGQRWGEREGEREGEE